MLGEFNCGWCAGYWTACAKWSHASRCTDQFCDRSRGAVSGRMLVSGTAYAHFKPLEPEEQTSFLTELVAHKFAAGLQLLLRGRPCNRESFWIYRYVPGCHRWPQPELLHAMRRINMRTCVGKYLDLTWMILVIYITKKKMLQSISQQIICKKSHQIIWNKNGVTWCIAEW